MLTRSDAIAVRRWTILSVLLLMTASATAEEKRYVIDTEHMSIAFLVEHIGFAKVLGRFREAKGEYTFDETSAVLSNVRIEVQTASVSTDHDRRDNHLRGGDFLDSDDHPLMVFTATSATTEANRTYTINGELELLGVKQPLQLKARWNKSGKYPFGGNPYVMGVSARGSFKRSAFGMTYAVNNGLVGDEVELIIEFEARPQ